eukprot:11403203-Alexandrium_andersonii.AAC.1
MDEFGERGFITSDRRTWAAASTPGGSPESGWGAGCGGSRCRCEPARGARGARCSSPPLRRGL